MKTNNHGANATKATLKSFASNEAPANAGFNYMNTFIKILKATFFYGGFLAVLMGIAATVYYVEEGFDIVGIAGSLMVAVLGGHVMSLYKPEV